ncbi:MAG: transporter, substrate-binding protein aliphatic sulfonates family [Sporomusa sp.]|nr:transporter, substrate-binding protein aliphatic sulfonates family [Sporomusa sp.]
MKSSNSIKHITSATVLTLLLMFVIGCTNHQPQKTAAESQGKQPDIIRVATPVETTSPSIFYIGEDLGFFAEEGIKLEYVGVVPSTQLVASVVAGKIDVGGAHVNRTIAGISAGAKIKAVAAASETTLDMPHMTYVTLDTSPIKNAQDMVGKKIGLRTVGGCNEYTPYAYLRKAGITDPKNKIQIITMPDSQLEQALRQGDIDIAGLHQTPDFIAERQGLKVLFTDYDVWGTIGGATPLYFSTKFISEKPDIVKRFTNAVGKTNNWINTNPQKAVEITAKRANRDVTLVKKGYYAPGAVIKEETVTVWIELLKEFGEIKGDIKPEQIYTNEFNSSAHK